MQEEAARERIRGLLGPDITINLGELFYDRNPGDARVKVGSDRKVFSRQTGQRGCRRDQLYNNRDFARGDPPNLARLYGNLLP